MDRKKIIVGIADLNIAKNPDSIITLGLGSCVGISIYEPKKKIAGLAHVMLPDSGESNTKNNGAKFADTAIVELLKLMIKNGANKNYMVAKVIGGAQMFALTTENDSLKIGDRNVKAVLLWLRKLNVPIVSQDVGGNYGRSIEIFSETGEIVVKTIGHGIKTL